MINQIRIYLAEGDNPYTNLAIEKRLLDTTDAQTCVLYLWQNRNTVVIGRNQNAWVECRTALLEQEQGFLARRLSGGGAVFHDLGNLNFTFLVAKENYNLDKQLEVILQACRLAGIQAEKSGRNDILSEGRKFSGNAFYQNQTHAYHHGTLLVDVDMDKLQRYLSPPKAKLEAKGVSSVRSRVVNLSQLSEGLTCDTMKAHMCAAFAQVYGLEPTFITLTEEDLAAVKTLETEYSRWEYLYGASLPFEFSCEARYGWGNVQLQLNARRGVITEAKVYSDAMDWAFPQAAEAALVGCRFSLQDMCQALRSGVSNPEIAEDLCALLAQQSL